jgi:plasmid stabilization system protein ParE
VVLTAVAEQHIRAIAEWWVPNRPRAPDLFAAELQACLSRIAAHPESGAEYTRGPVRGVRRTLLRRSRYHVYYTFDATDNLLIVRAVWHAGRGSGPALR